MGSETTRNHLIPAGNHDPEAFKNIIVEVLNKQKYLLKEKQRGNSRMGWITTETRNEGVPDNFEWNVMEGSSCLEEITDKEIFTPLRMDMEGTKQGTFLRFVPYTDNFKLTAYLCLYEKDNDKKEQLLPL